MSSRPDVPTAYTDPTYNVMSLVRAEAQRQDDLREMNDRHLRDMINVRADDNRELIIVRAEYEEKLRLAEAKRIDAIRAVDVAALNRAQEVALQQASALAQQVTTVADTFRTALSTELGLIRRDIAELRELQSAQAGAKVQVAETRSAAGETRLNLGAVISVGALLISLVVLIVLLTS